MQTITTSSLKRIVKNSKFIYEIDFQLLAQIISIQYWFFLFSLLLRQTFAQTIITIWFFINNNRHCIRSSLVFALLVNRRGSFIVHIWNQASKLLNSSSFAFNHFHPCLHLESYEIERYVEVNRLFDERNKE